MSPYIFVLCLERLSQFIELMVDHKLWIPIKIARNGPPLSHLCFADDLILFAKATREQVRIIKGVLELFCKISGQKINQNKSCIFFSKNVSNSCQHELSSLMGFQLTNNLGRYLGVPFLHERAKALDFQFILDHMS